MLQVKLDKADQPYIQWHQGAHIKRAWIQRKKNPDKDWAGVERYLNVVRCDDDGRPAGNATDFPIYDGRLSDEHILQAFVVTVCAITGCRLPKESGD
jgi:hypothetical protein